MLHPQLTRQKGGTSAARWTVALAALGLALGTSVPTAQAETVNHGVAAGLLKVDQNGDVANTNVVVTPLLTINGFTPFKGDWWTNNVGDPGFLVWNTGDYHIQIGADTSDDVNGGVMISSVAQNGRQNIYKDVSINPDGEFYLTNAFPISTVHDGNNWRICSYRNPTQSAGSGEEFNVNVAGAWFPYSKYLGALVRNSGRSNGGTNNTLIGSAGLQIGTHFKWVANGKFIVDLTGMGVDSRTDGVLLVNGGKDENNFALSGANATNGTWNVWVKDMATTGFSSTEQDPVVFVYVPKTNTDLISGKFNGDGSIALYSGDKPRFTVTPGSGAGRFVLKIDGYSPSTGVLVISAEVGGNLNSDNIVSYQPTEAGDGWEIQSRDTPGMGLQTPVGNNGEPEPVCSFVFVPAPTPGVQVTPSRNVLTTEAGTTASFAVVLDAMPTADVTIPVSSSDTSEGTVDVSSLVFTPANWDAPQTVTVTGQDDAQTDGQIAYSIVLGAAVSADARYNGMNPVDVLAINSDNEAGISLSATSLTTTEAGGVASFDVSLNSAPTADVTIALSSSDTTEGTIVPTSLTFTPANWSTPQTVTVTGVDDLVDDGDVTFSIVTAAAVSSDATYSGLNALDVAVGNINNDTAGVKVSTNSVTVSETGTTATFTVVLNSQPTGNVTVSLSSSDTAEGTVSPATMTFTPANWNVAQTATVKGVDDFTNNGVHQYSINLAVSSADSLYNGIAAPSVAGTTLDNEGSVDLAGQVYYGLGSPAIGIAGRAVIVDDRSSYVNGSLTVSVVGGSASDVLAVRNTGTAAGQIGVSGSTVTFEGVTIGSVSGGTGAPLVVTFNAAATPASAQALLRSVTYRSTSTAPVRETRTLSVALNNGVGGVSSATQTVNLGLVNVYEFQNGVDYGFGPYSGTADIELSQQDPGTPLPEGDDAVAGLYVAYELIAQRQVLMRFDNLVGSAAGQIPANARILSAELLLQVNNSGNGATLHRMLTPWDATNDTWNSLWDGVSADGVDAAATYESFWGCLPRTNTDGTLTYSGASGAGLVTIGVTPDVQAWVNGTTNLGWFFRPWDLSKDPTGFSPSESTNITARPRLRVKWVPASTQVASFRQGVDGYTGAIDTQIRETDPDVNYATNNVITVDYEATSEMLDSQSPMLRFENIVGSAAGQIPANSLVHAALLELTSNSSDSVGDGGLFHAILQPWQDTTTTWNSWNDGIEANGIEAAVTPTTVAGNASRSPDVQSTVNYFDVTSDVQAWVAGTRPNYGWVVLPWFLGGNGWGFGSAKAELAYRPRLTVYFTPGALPENIVLQAPAMVDGKVQLTFTGTAGRTYSVQRVSALGGAWTTLGTTAANSSGVATYTDNSPLPNAGFYRIAYP